MMGCYRSTFRLLELIGTRSLVNLQDRLDVGFRDADGSTDRLTATAPLPPPFDLLVGMLRLKRLSLRERVRLVRVARAAMVGAHPEETVTELLVRLGQSPRARARLWDPLVIATLNTAPDEASAELFLAIMRRAFLGSGVDSRLAIPRVGLSRLIEPAVEYITAAGGSVELGASVTAIERGEGAFTVRVKDRSPVDACDIVVALPPRSAATLLAPHDIGIDAEPLALSPIVSVYLWYDRPLPTIPELTALLGTSIHWVFNRRRMMGAGSGAPGLLSCTTSAAETETAATADEVIATADRELRGAFGEIGEARLVDAIVVKEKHATFRARPDIAGRRPNVRTALPGLYLAGDWTATGLPATIEGAAQSGFDAAAALIEDRIGAVV
jgi:hydroxysqualene dehydroxylase